MMIGTDFLNIKDQVLVEGDCFDILKQMPPYLVDVVICSPPYNLEIDYGTYKDDMCDYDYLKWMETILWDIHRVLKDNGSFFLILGSTNKKPHLVDDIMAFARHIFTLQNHIIWVKSISIDEKSYGHFKPINSDRYLNNNWEHIFHFTKVGNVKIDRLSIGVPYVYKDNIERWSSVEKDVRCRGNVWFIPYETITSRKDRGKHPAVFPAELALNCINLHGFDENTIVLDPFVGIGTTLLAAQKLGVKGIGIDLNRDYLDFARKRLGILSWDLSPKSEEKLVVIKENKI